MHLVGMSRSTHSADEIPENETATAAVDLPAGGLSAQAPVTLPCARITVEEAGTLAVTLDGEDFPAPPERPPWARADLGDLLDAVTQERSRTVRVEIKETDGTTFTDIIYAAPRRKRAPSPEKSDGTASAGEKKPSKKPRSMRVEGFAPGESVAVAVVAEEVTAGVEGTAEIPRPKGRPRGAQVLIVYGRASGRVKLRGLS